MDGARPAHRAHCAQKGTGASATQIEGRGRSRWSASGARRTNSARDHEESLAAGGQVSSQEEEAAGRHGTGQTAWIKGDRDDQGFPFSVSVTVSVTI